MDERVLGDYTIVKQIGQGSLGGVYLAEHRFMKRQYILKVLPEELGTDRPFIQRFEEEVKRLAALEHPHIVKIHNVSFAQGVYFLVTDCIVDSMSEPTNLAQWLSTQQGALDEKMVLGFLRQIADALDYAHGVQGTMIHRGLKLNNILIGQSKQEGPQIYLSDFGLSKIVGSAYALTKLYEAFGERETAAFSSFVENYAFLAPEQRLFDEKRPVDSKADVYAFGVLAYHLLTRQFPEGVFPYPSEVVPSYQLNWDDLIRQCLQSNSAERPEWLLDALDEVEEPSLPAAPSPVFPQKAQVTSIPFSPAPKLPIESAAKKTTAATMRVVTPQKTEAPSIQPTGTTSIVESLERLRADPQVRTYQVQPKEEKSIEPILTDMVVIDGGTFWRGSNEGSRDEMPAHQVRVPNFAVDIHPVTNEQFILFLEYTGGEKDGHNHDLIILRDSRVRRSSGKLVIESGYAKHPVVGVTWYGAVAYAQWVGKRLPSEAEWEIASKGGEPHVIYPSGDTIERTQANFFSSDTTAVMSYAANPYGLFDMPGNVYEWCQDWYSYNYYDASSQEPDNPTGPLQGVYRVLRGGCWKSLSEDLRCAHRHRNNPGTVNGTYGFRCAQVV